MPLPSQLPSDCGRKMAPLPLKLLQPTASTWSLSTPQTALRSLENANSGPKAPPPDAVNSYQPTGCPGGRAPHLWLGDGRSLYDALGFEFTLLQLGAKPADPAPFRAAAAAMNMPLSVVPIANDEARELYGADLALIRPDQIVAWRGNSTSGAADVLRRATGHV